MPAVPKPSQTVHPSQHAPSPVTGQADAPSHPSLIRVPQRGVMGEILQRIRANGGMTLTEITVECGKHPVRKHVVRDAVYYAKKLRLLKS